MFNFFKKKSPAERLQQQYEKLMKEAHTLSTRDRKASDLKYAEADAIADKLEALKALN